MVKKASKSEGAARAGKNAGDCRILAAFEWTDEKASAAIALAEGKTQKQVTKEVGVPERTQRSWLAHPDFAAEVDRLSLMVNIASRAERLRLAMRVVRSRAGSEVPKTDRDLLDWLKFAQSETDGVKLDLTKLAAAFGENDPLVALGGSPGEGEEIESDPVRDLPN